jgi:tetratricopeptide (TPR) repeat protein
MGRLLAQQQLQGGRGQYNQAARRVWEDQFKLAQRINPNRPQLYYDWGLALSHACSCTQNRSLAQADAAAIKSSPAKTPPQVVSRGLDTDDETATELPRPAKQSETNPSDKAVASDSTTAKPDATKTAAGNQSNESSDPGIAIGPTPAGSEAAVQALTNYQIAERLNPRWWQIPLARAELMLNQCDRESPQGERVAIHNLKPDFLAQILQHGRKPEAGNIELVPQPDMIASRGDSDATASASTATGTAASNPAAELPLHMPEVLTTALDDFNKTISLNPSAIDAYRDRGEVLRLLRRLDEAKQSATVACKLCYYRQVGSLRTLAQINNDLQLFEPAADCALRAAELASRDDQQRYLQLWYKCAKMSSGDTAKIAVASGRAGYVASRGDEGDATGNAEKPDRPAHIEPPPGFMQRGSTAVPD